MITNNKHFGLISFHHLLYIYTHFTELSSLHFALSLISKHFLISLNHIYLHNLIHIYNTLPNHSPVWGHFVVSFFFSFSFFMITALK